MMMERLMSGIALSPNHVKYFHSYNYRGAYLAAVAAILTNITVPIMFDKTPEWVTSCQTYEGGFAALPGKCGSCDTCDVIKIM